MSEELPLLSPVRVAQDIERFTQDHQDAKARWLYCLSRMQHRGGVREGGAAAAARFINRGTTNSSVLLWLRRINRDGFDAVAASGHGRLTVGPLPVWCVGHVYFLRVASHPHVLKIGFSRRVSDRVEEVRSKAKCRLELDSTSVGTLLDEQQWHHRLSSENISGEWFFDPSMSDRSLPPFLATAVAA